MLRNILLTAAVATVAASPAFAASRAAKSPASSFTVSGGCTDVGKSKPMYCNFREVITAGDTVIKIEVKGSKIIADNFIKAVKSPPLVGKPYGEEPLYEAPPLNPPAPADWMSTIRHQGYDYSPAPAPYMVFSNVETDNPSYATRNMTTAGPTNSSGTSPLGNSTAGDISISSPMGYATPSGMVGAPYLTSSNMCDFARREWDVLTGVWLLEGNIPKYKDVREIHHTLCSRKDYELATAQFTDMKIVLLNDANPTVETDNALKGLEALRKIAELMQNVPVTGTVSIR